MDSAAFTAPLVVQGSVPRASSRCNVISRKTYRTARVSRVRMSADVGDSGVGSVDVAGAAPEVGGDVLSVEAPASELGSVGHAAPSGHDAGSAGAPTRSARTQSAPDLSFADSDSSVVAAVDLPAAVPGPAAGEEEDDKDDGEAEGAVQGPAMARTEAGVSDVNLSGVDLALMQACYTGDTAAVDAALDAGGSPSCADVNQRGPLHFAAAHGLRTLCARLAGAGAALNAQDLLGYTPLHMAVGYERVETVRELLALGADANVCTFEDRLPVEIAEAALDSTREQRVLGWVRNQEVLDKRRELVEILDAATEEEEDDEEEEETGVVADEGMTVVVRKRAPAEGVPPPKPAPVPDSDVKVTIRVKGKTMER